MIRRSNSKSNTELTTSLRANLDAHRLVDDPNDGESRRDFRSWTEQQGDNLYIPALHFHHGLQEERSAYDITIKLFFLPNVPASGRCQYTKDAIELVLKELKVDSIDLLIVSFPGIAFDADDESEEDEQETTPTAAASLDPNTSGGEDIESMVKTWRVLEGLHDSGVIDQLGIAEFGTQRLTKFLAATRVRPSVDQINVRDCCVVPKPLIMFAKQEHIELLTHNDCTNILPAGTLRELLGAGNTGIGLLREPGSERKSDAHGLIGEVEPQWVIKYTAVVKDRGVVENKGYFALAEMNSLAT